jgi:outer membrane murein-binding lipoprotein Lpp
VEEEAKVKQLKENVARVQSQVGRYAMLPHDEKAAKKDVEKLKAELERLRRKRDAMWENVTNG